MLELGPLLDRRAAGLAADGKQKISLGRGLVRSDVAAILFDEPLTVIDPHLKWLLRRKLKEVHARFRRTLVYVTHDQNEALTFAQKVVVMYDGRIVQLGTPQDLFERPAHRFVGFFIGSPGMNFLPCDGRRLGRDDRGHARRPGRPGRGRRGGSQGPARGRDQARVPARSAEPAPDGVPAELRSVRDLGNFKLVTAALGPHTVVAKLDEDARVPQGRAWLRFPPERTMLYADDVLVGNG